MGSYEYTDAQGKKYTLDDMPENQTYYQRKYDEQGFFDKMMEYAKTIGAKGLNEALQLYYVTQRPDCPQKMKLTIFAALGYFILPIDVIPDVIPVVGFTDDLGVIAATLALAQMYINDEVKAKARARLAQLFGQDILARL